MKDVDDNPTRHLPPPNLEDAGEDEKRTFLTEVAISIMDQYILDEEMPSSPAEMLQKIDDQAMSQYDKQSERFCCSVTDCSKTYTSVGWLKSHLKKVHGIDIEAVTVATSEPDDQYDGVKNYASSFMKVALLFRDTRDAYKMGDGDRLFRNIKFLMLHFDQSTHIKYRLWLWRMQAYDLALLSEYESYAYRWNMAINVTGGTRRCIANDTLVEIHVHKVKELMRSMGANISYPAVRRASKCLGTVQRLMDQMGSYVSGRHADFTSHKLSDVKEMSSCLHNNRNLLHTPRREHANYPNFPGNLLNSVDLVKLSDWLYKQKSRAKREMQF